MAGDGAHFVSSVKEFEEKYALACRMIDEGFAVFRLRPNTKLPYSKGGVKTATRDKAKLRRWFEKRPKMNYGVATGDGVVLDIDVTHGQPGLQSLEELAVDGVEFPNTLQVTTPTGGMHIYYSSDTAIGQRDLAPAINVRATGGYAVGPGSTIDGEAYKISNDTKAVSVPQSLLPRLSKPGEKHEDTQRPLCELDLPGNVQRAIAYLETLLETPEGTRNNTAFKVACQLKEHGLSEARIYETMLDYWNEKCNPPLDEYELEKVVQSAWLNSKSPPGANTPQADFADIPPPLKFEDDESDDVSESFFTTATHWIDKEPEPTKWVVDGYIPEGVVTLLVSAGGRGKTLLSVQLITAVSSGIDFLGHKVEQGHAAGLFCEDDDDELHRRTKNICKQLDIEFASIADRIHIRCIVGGDVTLGDGKKSTPHLQSIENYIKSNPEMKLLVLDGASHLFTGNENDRGLVTRFINGLNRLANEYEIAIILIAHESKGSATNDTHAASGSTSWLNIPRSVIKIDMGEDNQSRHSRKSKRRTDQLSGAADSKIRVIHHIKVNKGQSGPLPPLTCSVAGGVFTPLSYNPKRVAACKAYVQKKSKELIKAGRNLSPSKNAGNYIAKQLQQRQTNTDYSRAEIEAAVDELEGSWLELEDYESGNRTTRKRYALVEDHSEDEPAAC